MWEWVFDGYDAGWYAGGGSICNDCANISETARVNRGGGWYSSVASFFRAANRASDGPAFATTTSAFAAPGNP